MFFDFLLDVGRSSGGCRGGSSTGDGDDGLHWRLSRPIGRHGGGGSRRRRGRCRRRLRRRRRRRYRLQFGHVDHQGELLVGDVAVVVFVGEPEHGLDVVVTDVLRQVLHYRLELLERQKLFVDVVQGGNL